MRKSKMSKILAFALSGMLLCTPISPTVYAAEETATVEEMTNTEQTAGEESQEQEVIDEKEESVEETTAMEEVLAEEEVAEETVAEETSTDKIQNLEQASFEEFEEATAKLIAEYDEKLDEDTIASNSTYMLKRLLVKGLGGELDFSDCGAEAIIKGSDNVTILQFATEELTEQAKNKIDQMDGVKYCDVDQYISLGKPQQSQSSESVPMVDGETEYLSWGSQRIAADKYVKHIADKQDEFIVAVIDTGITLDHPYFQGKLALEHAYNYAYGNTNVQDDHLPSPLGDPRESGHGTHVSGTILDATTGLNVKILPLKALNAAGDASDINVANAIIRAARVGAKVANLSLGGPHESNYLEEAIQYAVKSDTTVVVASGNDTQSVDNNGVCPAHIPECIVVGAIDKNENYAPFSNYGKSVDLVAPGVRIFSTVNNSAKFSWMDGTSMATPHVSAAAALLKINNPSLTPSQIESLLTSNAKDLGEPGKDIYYGAGMVDLTNLIEHDYSDVETIEKATPDYNGTITAVCETCGDEDENVSTPIYRPEVMQLSQTEYIYTGTSKKPSVTILDAAGKTITSNNYTISYEKGRIEVGTYKVKVKFKGKYYEGEMEKEIHINKAPQKFSGKGCTKRIWDAPFKFLSVQRTKGDGVLTYKSSNPKVATITSDGEVTIKGVGKTTITITASETEHYKKTVKKNTITVTPAVTNIKSVRSYSRRSFTATWNRDKIADAYQIQYSTSPNFSNAKITTVGSRTTSKTISKLQTKKKYYVRLRTYKKVSGVKYYSPWSATSTIVTK